MVNASEESTSLRKRTKKVEDDAEGDDEQDPLKSNKEEEMHDELDEETKEYIEYFRKTYGDNPRGDFIGVDGWQLFCLIYVFIAGIVLTIIFFSMYARHNPFGPNGFLNHWNEHYQKLEGKDIL